MPRMRSGGRSATPASTPGPPRPAGATPRGRDARPLAGAGGAHRRGAGGGVPVPALAAAGAVALDAAGRGRGDRAVAGRLGRVLGLRGPVPVLPGGAGRARGGDAAAELE